jgi:hypothetical protein
MRSEIVRYNRLRNISPERVSDRGELARSDDGNPSARRIPRGQRANRVAQQDPTSDEELSAQTWLDEQLVKFYHMRNGRWPKLRRLFTGAFGGG